MAALQRATLLVINVSLCVGRGSISLTSLLYGVAYRPMAMARRVS